MTRKERRIVGIAAKKHVTIFTQSTRGPTDPLLRKLREKLKLPSGFRLEKSKATAGSPLFGSVHIKEATSGNIVRTLSAEEIEGITGHSIRS